MRRRLLAVAGFGPDGRIKIGTYECVNLQLTGAGENILWTTCNLGADTESYSGCWYKYCSVRCSVRDTYAWTGTTNPIPPDQDTATRVMGSNFRIPTNNEYIALTSQTTNSVVTINGVSR